ncbi:MAG: RuBisCO large subunit C-terminal-like domain-containing protein [Candidatus Freyarchaeum deiterrae]
MEGVFFSDVTGIDPENHIICTYYVETSGSLESAGEAIAAEESIGTWTDIKTIKVDIQQRLAAKAFKFEEKEKGTGLIKIAFPLELFDLEKGGIPNIMSMITGNLFGLSALKNVRLLDAEFPKSVLTYFPGPKFGLEGVRKIVGTKESRRPHLGTIIKPKVGLNPSETAEVAYEAAVGGVDFIKDDETLVSQSFCPLEERLSKVMEKIDLVKEETGRTVFYALNITGNVNTLYEFADYAVENGANMIMLDILLSGLAALQRLAEDPSITVPLHCHRTFHAAFTKNPVHGVHMKVIGMLTRLAGGDQLHSGTAAGKMGIEEETPETLETNAALLKEWGNMKTVMPVASGGIHPALVPKNLEVLGTDLVINAGGGIHGHPDGTRAGAAAMRQAIDAVMKKIPLEKYAKTHKELQRALEKWGYRYVEKPESIK